MNPIVCFTDGASSGNPGPGGWGIVCTMPDKSVEERGGGEAHTTNNRMELEALIQAIRFVEPYLEIDPKQTADLCSDSAYVVNGSNQWLASWKRKGWKTSTKEPVLNQDLWNIIDAFLERYKGRLKITKVAGHAGVELNERADVIASSFAQKKEIVLSTRAR